MHELIVPGAAAAERRRALLHLEVVCMICHAVVWRIALCSAMVLVGGPPGWHGKAR